MTQRLCAIPECTFSETGMCLHNHASPDECPDQQRALHLVVAGEDDVKEASADAEELQEGITTDSIGGGAVLTAPDDKPQLPRSGTLGLRDADALMAKRYVNMIGVVGLPDAGKTACVACLYLLLAHKSLSGFSFASSETLMAFEEIARGSRRWNDGNPPAQMTAHTEMADDRQAGFLHLRLQRDADGRKFDFLLPDLPGEWSRKLINNGQTDRFEFLKSAEVVWLMADGRQFQDRTTRKLAVHTTINLLERLTEVVTTPRPRVILVASWGDAGEIPGETLEDVKTRGAEMGFEMKFVSIASFSDNPDMAPGNGMAELIDLSIAYKAMRPNAWPDTVLLNSARSFLRFGSLA